MSILFFGIISLLPGADQTYRHGQPVVVDGETLSVPAVAAVARYGANVVLDDSSEIQDRVLKSRQVIADKVSSQKSVYGVSTGFGGSGKRNRTQRVADYSPAFNL